MVTRNIFEENPKKTIGAIALIVILLIDVFVTNLYKLYFGHNFNDRKKLEAMKVKLEAIKVEQSYRIESDVYHHDLARNVYIEAAGWGSRKYAVATDSLGFKSQKPRNTPMKSNNYRIVFIGDSFTEGIGLRYEETFVGRIATALSGRNIEVLNAAVSSYSPIVYYRKIKYLLSERGLKFNELVVFIDISDIQDEALYYEMSPSNTVEDKKNKENKENKYQIKDLVHEVKAFIADNSIFIYSLLNEIHDYLVGVSRLDVNLTRSMWTVDKRIYRDYGIVGLSKAKHYMNLLYDLLEEHNVELTIAVYPWPDQIINSDLNSVQVEYWQNWAKEQNVTFLNYFPFFIKDDCDEQCRYQVLDDLFIEGDVHWNKSGHKLISDGFLSFYMELRDYNAEQSALR